ncbi:P-loop containing nucleoside triphosphate hydrolase protein [Xylariaceae sp. FL1272]|nr:P-loop containing nucleoside triphosphate hydrolase protein [Xylariaceae sp. FL1272]
MYSRYIPPTPGKLPANSTATLPSPASETDRIPKPSINPTTYARYVPSQKTSTGSVQLATRLHHEDVGNDCGFTDRPPAKKVKLAEPSPVSRTSQLGEARQSNKGRTVAVHSINQSDVDDGSSVSQRAMKHGHDGEDSVDTTEGLPERKPACDPDSTRPTEKDSSDRVGSEGRRKKGKSKTTKNGEAHSRFTENVSSGHRAMLEKKAKSMGNPPEKEHSNDEPGLQDAVLSDTTPMDFAASASDERGNSPDAELHGLEPIPQPKPIVQDISRPSYEILPSWLASPIRVTPDSAASWTDIALSPDLAIAAGVAERLAEKGYQKAFAIQTGVIPLLLPHHCRAMQSDVLVSAATGSGKTLAYTLPMIRDLSQGSRQLTRLRALIVLPTRELVRQVQQVCDQCAGIFSLEGAKRRPRIATAMGSQSLEQEQSFLIEREERYEPEPYEQHMTRSVKSSEHLGGGHIEDKEDSGFDTEDEERQVIQKKEAKPPSLPSHVVTYRSKVDVLICTPGRLVEHIKFTPGFTLDFVRWLVVDEADKLLGQNFQQWLDIVIPRVQSNDIPGARNHKHSNLSGVRKVILSATMTRDLDQLKGLKLRHPRLIVLDGSETRNEASGDNFQVENVLPRLLREAALKVNDPHLKPLFLVELLQSHHSLDDIGGEEVMQISDDNEASSDPETESEADSRSEGSILDLKPTTTSVQHVRTRSPSVLIFTRSNEATIRLSRLLKILIPADGSKIGLLTSTTPYTTRRDTMRQFSAGRLRILVASDLVARGIDLPSLDHVINYDMPSSIASYVHRVGRTARAGKSGQAWTLFTNPEARWFWNEIAGSNSIQRSTPVERITVRVEKGDISNTKVAAYEAALAQLGQEAREALH